MEDQKMNQQGNGGHPDGCRCFMCQGKMMGREWGCGCGWHGHRHFILRAILGIIILAMVFSLGVKIGEIKGSFEGGYGYDFYGGRHMMMPYGYGGYPYPTESSQGTAVPPAAQPQSAAPVK